MCVGADRSGATGTRGCPRAKFRGSAGLTFARPRPRPRPGIARAGSCRSVGLSSVVNTSNTSAGPPSVGCRTPRSFRALAGMAAAIALLGRTTGRWGAPEGVVAIGVTSKARESRYQTRRTAWSTGTEHRRSRTAPGLSRCRNPRHFHRATPHGNFAFAYVAAQRRTPLQIPIYGRLPRFPRQCARSRAMTPSSVDAVMPPHSCVRRDRRATGGSARRAGPSRV